MGYVNGKFCCECDYCAVSPCQDSGAWGAWEVGAIFLTDHLQTRDYYLFCPGHQARAEADVQVYLLEHPGVEIDPND